MKPGDRQLKLLLALGCPGMALVVSDKLARSCERRGWLASRTGDGHMLSITPSGLRAVADALESGRADKFLQLWDARA